MLCQLYRHNQSPFHPSFLCDPIWYVVKLTPQFKLKLYEPLFTFRVSDVIAQSPEAFLFKQSDESHKVVKFDSGVRSEKCEFCDLHKIVH